MSLAYENKKQKSSVKPRKNDALKATSKTVSPVVCEKSFQNEMPQANKIAARSNDKRPNLIKS